MVTVFVKWRCCVSSVNAVHPPEVPQRRLTPPPRDLITTRAYYTASDQLHHVYLVLIPDDVPARNLEPIITNDPDNETRETNTVANRRNTSSESNDATPVGQANRSPGYERREDGMDSAEHKTDHPACTVSEQMSNTPGQSHTEDGTVGNAYNRLSVVIPEESEDFVWL